MLNNLKKINVLSITSRLHHQLEHDSFNNSRIKVPKIKFHNSFLNNPIKNKFFQKGKSSRNLTALTYLNKTKSILKKQSSLPNLNQKNIFNSVLKSNHYNNDMVKGEKLLFKYKFQKQKLSSKNINNYFHYSVGFSNSQDKINKKQICNCLKIKLLRKVVPNKGYLNKSNNSIVKDQQVSTANSSFISINRMKHI